MGPYVDSITPDEVIPPATGVVVIGGGIIGTSAALTLAERGIPVVLCEKGYIGCEQSSRNWGWCRQAGRDAREMPLIVESLRLWRDMDRLTGSATGFRECGVMYVGESEDDEIRFADWLEMARTYDTGARILRREEVEALMPGARSKFRCALHVPTDGCAEPQRAAPAIARAAQRQGASMLAHCAVRGIERAAGRVGAVITERGRIACDAVILAGGAWTSLFCASLGVRLPQLKVLSSVMRTAPVTGGPDTCSYLNDVAYRKRLDGGYTIARGSGYIVPLVPDSVRYLREFLSHDPQGGGRAEAAVELRNRCANFAPRAAGRSTVRAPSNATRVLDPAPNKAHESRGTKRDDQALSAVSRRRHRAGVGRIHRRHAGCGALHRRRRRSSRPDVATGFSGHGFGIGPAAGRLAADLATGRTPAVDPRRFACRDSAMARRSSSVSKSEAAAIARGRAMVRVCEI